MNVNINTQKKNNAQYNHVHMFYDNCILYMIDTSYCIPWAHGELFFIEPVKQPWIILATQPC